MNVPRATAVRPVGFREALRPLGHSHQKRHARVLFPPSFGSHALWVQVGCHIGVFSALDPPASELQSGQAVKDRNH